MIAAWSAYSSLLMRAPVDVQQTSPRAESRPLTPAPWCCPGPRWKAAEGVATLITPAGWLAEVHAVRLSAASNLTRWPVS
jgi:hypothetical protein